MEPERGESLLALPPTVQANVEARQSLTQLVAACDLTLEVVRTWSRDLRWTDHYLDSPRSRDRHAIERSEGPAGGWTTDIVDRTLHASLVYLNVAGKHLEGVRALVATGNVIFPVAPVVRSIVELCGRIRWVFAANTDLPTRQRVARMVLTELDDITQAVRLAKSTRNGNAARRLKRQRLAAEGVRLRAMFHPYEIVEDADGNRSVCGESMAGLVQLVKALEAPGLYDALSAASHPTDAYIRSKIRVGPGLAEPARSGDAEPLVFQTSLAEVGRLVRAGTLLYLQGWTLLGTYHGLNASTVDNLQEEVAELISPSSQTLTDQPHQPRP